MKKLLKYIFTGIGILLLIIFVLLAIGVNLYTIGAFLVDIISYVGNGSIVRGIIFTPFFIFGVIQIIHSFLLLGKKVQEEAEEGLFLFPSKKSDRAFDFGGAYVVLTFISYILVFAIIIP